MVKKFYMGESKPGSIEDAILGVWKEAAQEVDEKYTQRQKNIRDLARNKDSAATAYVKKTADDAPSADAQLSGKTQAKTRMHKGASSKVVSKHYHQRGVKKQKGAKTQHPDYQKVGSNDGPNIQDRLKAKKRSDAIKNRPKGMSGRSTGGDFGASVGVREKLAASFSPEEIENFEMIMDESVSTPEIEAVWKAAAENDMSGEKSYEMGTERYLKHTQKITPGQLEEEIAELDALIEELELTEGTWHIAKDMSGLKILMKKPIKLGNEGDDATEVVSPFIGDDQLYDDLIAAGKKNPRGDARPIIQKAMKRLRIKEEVELDEVEEGIAGNIVKGVGKSIAKGGKIAGKKFVVDPLKAKGKSLKSKIVSKAKSSLIGKGVGKVKSSIGKVKSGIKKAKEIGAGIKKMAQTGQAYGDEYNPMLDRLEIIEFKLTEYCKVLEEARQLKDPKKEMMVKSKDSGVIVIDKKDFKAYQKKGYFAVEETQREEEVVMEKKKLDKVDKDELKKSFDKRADDGDADIDNDGDEDDSDEFLHKKRKAISKAIDAKESLNLRDTIVKMWTEASSAVNPNDREDLDDGKGATGEGGKKTAAKMKRAKEPAPMVATEDMSVEEAQKQKTLSMKEALAKVWGFEEDWQKGYPKKKKMTPESKNGKTTDTGGKMAEVEIDPELKNKK